MENKNAIFKSVFKDELLDFVNYKRSIGYAYEKRYLNRFELLDNFFIKNGIKDKKINYELIEEWLKTSLNLSLPTRNGYYCTIKMFTEFLVMKNYDNITVPLDNPFRNNQKFIPYIFTHEQINNIFDNSKNTYYLLYVMLHLFYNCGFRISEAINLKLKDFLEDEKSIFINNSKNNCSRIIPITDDIYNIIKNYINSQVYETNEDYIFYNHSSRIALGLILRYYFHKVLENVGIKKRDSGNYPRIHDMRHTFAVHALEQMKNKGFDLYTSLPILSVYLGHKSIVSTEYYLRLVPEYSKNVLTSEEYITDLYSKEIEDIYEK